MKTRHLVVAPVVTMMLSGCGVMSMLGGQSQIAEAWEWCEESSDASDVASYDEDDDSIVIDFVPEYADDSDVFGYECLLSQLEVSSALQSQVDSTTAMMGRQNETEKGLEYTWTYHPDNGINMTIEKED